MFARPIRSTYCPSKRNWNRSVLVLDEKQNYTDDPTATTNNFNITHSCISRPNVADLPKIFSVRKYFESKRPDCEPYYSISMMHLSEIASVSLLRPIVRNCRLSFSCLPRHRQKSRLVRNTNALAPRPSPTPTLSRPPRKINHAPPVSSRRRPYLVRNGFLCRFVAINHHDLVPPCRRLGLLLLLLLFLFLLLFGRHEIF